MNYDRKICINFINSFVSFGKFDIVEKRVQCSFIVQNNKIENFLQIEPEYCRSKHFCFPLFLLLQLILLNFDEFIFCEKKVRISFEFFVFDLIEVERFLENDISNFFIMLNVDQKIDFLLFFASCIRFRCCIDHVQNTNLNSRFVTSP